jgi:hypothetical protein
MKNVIRLALSALSIVVLSACGGGSDSTVSQTSTGFSVEGGLVQKGPLLAGQRVTIAEVNPLTYNPAGLSYDLLTKDNMGGFSSSGINFTRQHIQTFAQGMFFNEITGKTVNDTVSLQAYGDLTVDRLVNVNVLTTLAAPRIKALVTDKTQTSYYRKFSAARTQAQKEVLAAFGIYNSADLMGGDTSTTTVTIPANFNEMDLATDAQANKMLVALSALVVQIGGDGVGISQFITQFQADLADNGTIDASAGSSTLQTRIAAASKTPNLMSDVATNLTAFYANSSYNILTSAPTFTAAQLSPWVDSSGGVDLVLDKFKSSSTTAEVGTVSKASLAYVVGSDDANQCLSVGSVSTGATGALYIDGATTASTTPVLVTKGQSVVLGLTASAAGTYAGFIQRSAATSGACPSTTPTTGTTRLQKYSITASSGTSTTVPGAPTIGAATAGDASASVAFTVPSSNGGATITGYTASCVSGTGATASTKTGTSTSSPITVSSLTNGTAYSCTVKATNSAGDSAASGAVSVTPVASTPVTVPGAPTIGAVTAGAAQASVAFTAPSSNGGATISSYTASCAVGTGTPASNTGTGSPIVVTRLTNGSTYSCSVTATNSAGTGPASGGVSVMPVDGVTTVPTKPTLNSATAGSTQITLAFTKAATGGTATSFTASCTASGVTKTATGTASPLVVTGLTAGTAYTCTVKASNAGGSSAASTSKSATPTAATVAVPDAPVIKSVTGTTSSVLVSFSAATSGSTPSYYSATCTPSGGTAVSSAKFSASPIWLSGLTNGLAYACTVTAGNSAGDGAASTSVSGTPVAASATLVAPSVKGVLPGDSRISVQFNYIGGKVTELTTAVSETPASSYIALCASSDGGLSNTSMGSVEYSSGTGSTPMANVTNPLMVSGLTNGKTYSCSIGSWAVDSSGKYSLSISGTSGTVIPNAGPSNASGVLASTANTTHISYDKYCGYTNETATGTGAVPSITYSTSATTTTTGTSAATFTCTDTTSRTLTGNALPDHRSSEFFTNGLSGYTGSPYFSGNPNKIGTKVVSKTMPYSGTISAAYTAGTNGYDTSSCYSYTTASSPSQNTNNTFTNSSNVYRCKFVSYNYANNSALLEPGTAETYVGTTNTYKVVGKNLYQDVGLDPSNAHNQPTMSGTSALMYGNYHYHGVPEGHVARIGKGNSTMTLIAFAADGFPIYARYGYTARTSVTAGVKVVKSNYRLRTAAELTAAGYTDRPSAALAPYGTFEQDWVFDANAGGDLDACNGRYGVTPESPTTSVYHYFVTDSYPFIQRCVFGQSPASWANGQ